jgi:hypothetical protein
VSANHICEYRLSFILKKDRRGPPPEVQNFKISMMRGAWHFLEEWYGDVTFLMKNSYVHIEAGAVTEVFEESIDEATYP